MARSKLCYCLILCTLPILFGFTAFTGDSVMTEIMNEAPKKRVLPIPAKIDRVEGAIPGYNGLEVDIQKTYEINKNNLGGRSIHYVYKEIPPSINLNQLGAAPIYRGNPHKPMVSFMINVAWGNEYLPLILDTLDKHHVKATFFLDGSWLKKNVITAKQIMDRGHELSNHAYSHKNMSQLSKSQAYQEISKTEKLLSEELQVKNRWFAPPSGDFDKETVEVAQSMKLNTVLWTLDTVDWRNPSPQSIVQKIHTKVDNGFLILMHPTRSASNALDGMITSIKNKGLYIGTVSEVLSTNRVPIGDQYFGTE
jgi:probable sporulation protein (polysaccharide deacetylase family)